MSNLQIKLVKQQLEHAINYLEQYIQLCNCHTVDFFTKSLFEKYFPKEIREEISKLGPNEIVNQIFNAKPCDKTPNLNNYLSKCKSFSLYNQKEICLSLEAFKAKLQNIGAEINEGLKLDVFMSEKKSHEVEVMSSIVASLKSISKCSHIIDVGDGKGYLSSMLALHFKIPVLGIDWSCANTNSASNRVAKLQKVWKGIMKNRYKIEVSSEEKFNENSLLYK